ncbi:MAG: hypothetical protein ACTSWW_10080 [Promethearchaeota archaeon]
MSDETYIQKNDTWSSIEKWVALAGKWSWVWLLLQVVIGLIGTILAIAAIAVWSAQIALLVPTDLFYAEYTAARAKLIGEVVWYFIGVAISLAALILFVRPFAKKCGERDWGFLVNDVIVIAGYRIPKMLILGVVLEIFTQGYGGLLVLIPVLLILFVGPVPVQWKE